LDFLDFMKLKDRETDRKTSCPCCNIPYFWTRRSKQEFENDGVIQTRCPRCSQIYRIVRTRDRFKVYTRVSKTT
jgi:uncharacterized C2H2 Zn-finger protein